MNSELSILTSREIIEQVVDEMDPVSLLGREPDGDRRNAAILAIQRSLLAENPRNSSIINVSYDAPNARVAQDVLSRITQLYLDKHSSVHRAGLEYGFLSQQTDQMAARLAETEQELRLAMTEVGITDIDEAEQMIGNRIAELSSHLLNAEALVAAAQARVDTLESHGMLLPDAVSDTVIPRVPALADPAAVALLESISSRLRRLQDREARLLATYTEKSALVQSVRREIDTLREEWIQAAEGGRASLSVVSTDLPVALARTETGVLLASTDLAALEAQSAVVKRHLEEAQQKASLIEASEAKIRKLQRRKEVEEANYLYFSKSLEQARIDDALDSGKISNISVVQKATRPLKGVRPGTVKRMGVALAAGVLFGLGLAFFVEKGVHARWFARPSEITPALGLPVLVSIPRVAKKAMMAGQSERSSAVAGSSSTGLLSFPNGFTSYCERIHHRLLLLDVPSKGIPVLGVTGCSHGSGVSMIASGIALSIAREEDTRVLLAASSLDSGAEVFIDEHGRVTVMDWNRTVIDQPGEAAALSDVTSPARRFREFRSRIEDGNHGCVVLDLPPVHQDGSVLSIASSLDGVILLVESEKDRRVVVRQCVELLNEARVPVLGVVFNKHRIYVPRRLSNDV